MVEALRSVSKRRWGLWGLLGKILGQWRYRYRVGRSHVVRRHWTRAIVVKYRRPRSQGDTVRELGVQGLRSGIGLRSLRLNGELGEYPSYGEVEHGWRREEISPANGKRGM